MKNLDGTLRKNNVALIGYGYWGKKVFKYLSKKKVYIKYIYTRKKIDLKNNTQDLKRIVQDSTVKKIFIVTPIDTHFKLAKTFKDKLIFVEKPLTLEHKNSKKILNNKNVFVDYLYRYSNSINKIIEYKKNNKLGRLKNIYINFCQLGRFNKYDINYLLNSHALSILSLFIDIEKTKYNVFPNFFNKKKVTDLNIDFKNKYINGNIFLSFNSLYKKMNLLFVFEKGSIEFLKLKNFSKLKISNYSRDLNLREKCKEFNFDENNNLDYSIEEFISNRLNYFNKQNIKISKILEKIEKIIYKKKKFFDKK